MFNITSYIQCLPPKLLRIFNLNIILIEIRFWTDLYSSAGCEFLASFIPYIWSENSLSSLDLLLISNQVTDKVSAPEAFVILILNIIKM